MQPVNPVSLHFAPSSNEIDAIIINCLKNNDTIPLRKLIANKGLVDFKEEHLIVSNAHGDQLLHVACHCGHLDVVLFLIERSKYYSCPIPICNSANKTDEYPLFKAIKSPAALVWDEESKTVNLSRDTFEIVKVLLDNGACFADRMVPKKWMDVLAHSSRDILEMIFSQPSHSDLFYVEDSPDLVSFQQALEYAFVDKPVPHGQLEKLELVQTILTVCTIHPLFNQIPLPQDIKRRKFDLIQFALEKGADPWRGENSSRRLVHLAKLKKDTDLLLLYLQHAIRKSDLTQIKDILSCRVLLPNQQNCIGDTVLHVACSKRGPKSPEILKLLEENGYDNPKIKNDLGITAYQLALRSDLEKFLMKKTTPLYGPGESALVFKVNLATMQTLRTESCSKNVVAFDPRTGSLTLGNMRFENAKKITREDLEKDNK